MAGVRFTDVRVLAEVDSTNRVALELAREGAPEGLVVVADHQSSGRGRLGRTWTAPPGTALLVSVLLRPAIDLERAALLTMAAGVAAVEACGAADVGMKWPNDLVTGDGRKLAGILAESTLEGPRLAAVVVGMGLNLRRSPGLAETGIALDDLGIPLGRDELLVAWLAAYDRRLDDLDGVVGAWRDRSATLGRRVRVELPTGDVEGTAADVDHLGRLLLDPDDGPRLTLSAGDVVHLRAT